MSSTPSPRTRDILRYDRGFFGRRAFQIPPKLPTVALAWLFFLQATGTACGAYTLGTVVGDMRQPAAQSGGTSCPQLTRFDVSAPGSINRQWSTSLGANPATILTSNQTPAGQLNEIEAVIQQALAAWTGVASTSLAPSTLAPLHRTSTQNACNSFDGMNSICFNQQDAGFALGVLAFTRVVSSDVIGEQLSAATPPSTLVGQILDADVLVAPGDPYATFATPGALAANPNAYDLQSILTHEVGHSFGFDHSGLWRAMMFPFAPPPGQITGVPPTPQTPDAQLSDDDRTGLRMLYPDSNDSVNVGSIAGRVLPANPLALPGGATGIFPAQVVAVNAATGAVVAAAMAGWSCSGAGPPQFDGSFSIGHLATAPSLNYQIYAEPLDGPVTLGNVIYNLTAICRNASSDPGWPAQYACTVPQLAQPFSASYWTGP